MENETLIDVLKGTARPVNFLMMISEQQEIIRKLERMAGSKPNKVEQAYFEQQKEKLKELEDIVRRWIWEAFNDDDSVGKDSMYWGEIIKNFDIKVIVSRKEK